MLVVGTLAAWSRPSAADPPDVAPGVARSSSSVLAAAGEPKPISLQDALAFAQQNAPAMIASRGAEETAAAGVQSAYAAFLPSLSVSAGASRQLPASRITPEGDRLPWSYSMGLGADVTLFSGGSRLFDIRRARAEAGAAVVGRVAQQYATALSVKQSYFEVLAQREAVATARAQLEEAERSFVAASARVRARTATRSDSLRAGIQRQSAQLAVMEAEVALVEAEAALGRLIGTSERVTAVESGLGEEAPLAEAEVWSLLEESPTVRSAEAGLAAREASYRSAWSDYLPSLSLSYSRGASAIGSSFDLVPDYGGYSGSARLSMSLPIFDRLQRRTRTLQARVARENAQAELRDARLAVREQLIRWLATYQTAGERVALLQSSVEAAEEDLRVQSQRYAMGSATQLDILTSQAQLVDVRRNLTRGRLDLRIARATIVSILGADL